MKINLRKSKKTKEKPKKEKEKKSLFKTILSIVLFVAIILISIFLIFALYVVVTSPDFDKTKLYQKEPTILYDKNGDELTRVGAKDSTLVTYDEIPDVLIDALVATEDSRFFQHNGLDLFRFLKASVLQVLGKSYAGGASTLSMQVIKNTYTSKEDEGIKGIIRKFTDIYMAVFKLEANYTKEEIIEFYFNSQWFANAGNVNVKDGIWGIEQASLYFFNKSSKDLNLAEASLLVGMFQNTRTHNPYNYPDNALKRQKTVLNLMVRHGYITEEEKDAVLEIPIESLLAPQETSGIVVESKQAFIDYALWEVEHDTGIDPRQVSLKIYTTFDPKVQDVLKQVEDGDIYKFPNDVVQEGIAVTDTKTGAIVALSGGRNYKARNLNHATDIRRQPGSTAKPIFDYAMYIENITQSTYAMLFDEPTTYTGGGQISNYDNKFKGLITMRYALEDSRNIPALRVFKEVASLDKKLIEDFVHSVGIDYGKDLFESASIGGLTNGVSPLQLSAAYAVFGRGGYYIEPYSYTRIINNETGEDKTYSYSKEKVLEESTAYMINNILVKAYGGKTASGSETAGKTGTTNLDDKTREIYNLKGTGAVRDAWIVSYSPSHSIALWYGYDGFNENSAKEKYYITSNTGGTARRTIMNGLAQKIHEKNTKFNVPKTVVKVDIELETFPPQLCSAYTPNEKNNDLCNEEYFVKGTEPTEVSKRFDTLDNPTNGTYSISGNMITLKWDAIKTPDAIDTNSLTNHFNTYYGEYASKYYEQRINYNNSYIGSLGYKIYLKDNNGNETSIGYTNANTFNYPVSNGGEYTFVIKSTYSIFTANMSSGLTINVKTIDPNVGSIVDDNTTPTN